MPTEDEDDSGTMGSTSTPHAPRRLISDDYQKQIEDYCLQRFEKRFQSLEQLLQRHLNSVGISAVIQSSLPAQPLGLLTPFETDSAREARELFDKYQASTTSGGGAGHGRYFHPTRKDLVTFLLNKMMGKLTEEQVLIYNVPNAFLLNTNKIPRTYQCYVFHLYFSIICIIIIYILTISITICIIKIIHILTISSILNNRYFPIWRKYLLLLLPAVQTRLPRRTWARRVGAHHEERKFAFHHLHVYRDWEEVVFQVKAHFLCCFYQNILICLFMPSPPSPCRQRSSDWRMVLYTLDKLSTCVSDELQVFCFL